MLACCRNALNADMSVKSRIAYSIFFSKVSNMWLKIVRIPSTSLKRLVVSYPGRNSNSSAAESHFNMSNIFIEQLSNSKSSFNSTDK